MIHNFWLYIIFIVYPILGNAQNTTVFSVEMKCLYQNNFRESFSVGSTFPNYHPNYYYNSDINVGVQMRSKWVKIKFSTSYNNLSSFNRNFFYRSHGVGCGFDYDISFIDREKLRFGFGSKNKIVWFWDHFSVNDKKNSPSVSWYKTWKLHRPQLYHWFGLNFTYNFIPNLETQIIIGPTIETSVSVYEGGAILGLDWWFSSGLSVSYFLPNKKK